VLQRKEDAFAGTVGNSKATATSSTAGKELSPGGNVLVAMQDVVRVVAGLQRLEARE
jgi:hypothetical protein